MSCITNRQYRIVERDDVPTFHAIFSTLSALQLQPVQDEPLTLGTEHYDFNLQYNVVLQSVATLPVEVEQEEDGRWIAEIPSLPGVMCYGISREEAISFARQLGSRVMSSRPTGGLVQLYFSDFVPLG